MNVYGMKSLILQVSMVSLSPCISRSPRVTGVVLVVSMTTAHSWAEEPSNLVEKVRSFLLQKLQPAPHC